MKKRTGNSVRKSKTTVRKRRPIVQYIVHAKPPEKVIMMDQDPYTPRLPVRIHQRDLRALMVIDQFNVGGTETHVLACVRELLRRGVHVAVAGKRGEMRDAFAALGCPIYEIDFVTKEYERNMQEEENIVSRLKEIMSIEGINMIHAHQMPSGYFAIKAGEPLRVPMVFTVHGRYHENDAELLRKFNAVVCVSPSLRKYLPSKLASFVIPNGIDTVQYSERPIMHDDLRKELGIDGKSPVFMFAGRLSWEKADICKDTIEACKRLKTEKYPDLQLLIAGEGHHSQDIRNLVEDVHRELGESFIHMLGNTLYLSPYYSICDGVIGTGRTAIETLACCRPLIAIGVKGFFGNVTPSNYEAAWDSWFGDHYATEKWSVDRIKDSLKQILESPLHEKKEQGWVGRNLVKEHFNITRTTDQLLDLYARIMDGRYTMSG